MSEVDYGASSVANQLKPRQFVTFNSNGGYIFAPDMRRMSQKVHQLDLSLQTCCYNILVLVFKSKKHFLKWTFRLVNNSPLTF